MAGEAQAFRNRRELLDQAGLANAGLAAHKNGLTRARLPAGVERARELPQFRLAADEGVTSGSRGVGKEAVQSPHQHGLLEAFHLDLAHRRAVSEA